jgi:NAD(P)-dependent dehydrogenase (short-subunit alcohol dehydrogenase family)
MSKVVIITGSTGELGPAVVEKFVKAGMTVIASYRSEKKFQHLIGRVSGESNLIGVKTDLTNEGDVKNLFSEATKQGRLDALCHIAGGFWMGGDISETSLDNWNKMMNLNLMITFLCTREAFGIMKKQQQGHIITLSAQTALELPVGKGAYAVSKAGVLALMELVAKEGQKYNIKVNTILPSTIDTKENRKSMPNADFDKWVKPEEIAKVIFELAGGGISAISGTAIKMYGKV